MVSPKALGTLRKMQKCGEDTGLPYILPAPHAISECFRALEHLGKRMFGGRLNDAKNFFMFDLDKVTFVQIFGLNMHMPGLYIHTHVWHLARF